MYIKILVYKKNHTIRPDHAFHDMMNASTYIMIDTDKISEIITDGSLSKEETINKIADFLIPHIRTIQEGEDSETNVKLLKSKLNKMPINDPFIEIQDCIPLLEKALNKTLTEPTIYA